MNLKDFISSLRGDFSIVICKNDGTYSESIDYRTRGERRKALDGLRKARELAERTDLEFDMVSVETETVEYNGEYRENAYMLIGLKEV